MILVTESLNVSYGRTHAVNSVSIQLEHQEIVAVLGANGAGKSSLLKAILGTVPIAGGRVRLAGKDITRWRPTRKIQEGLVLVPEGRQIFISLTVHENLLMGAYCRSSHAVGPDIEKIYERFPNLAQRRDMPASVLSGGEQQMLAIGRALLARPTVLMLDEPSLGLSPLLVGQLFDLIRELNDTGMAILLVEQNIHKALQIADRSYVLELGSVVLSGTSAELAASGKLEEAYLGRN